MPIYRPDSYTHTTIYYPIIDGNDAQGGLFIVDNLTDLETYPAHKLRVGQLGKAGDTMYMCTAVDVGALANPAGWVGDTSTWEVWDGGSGIGYWAKNEPTLLLGPLDGKDTVVIGPYSDLTTYVKQGILDLIGDLVFVGDSREIKVGKREDAGSSFDLTISAGDAHTSTLQGGHLYLTGGAGGVGSGSPTGGNVYIYGHSGDSYGNVILGWDGVDASTGSVGINTVPAVDFHIKGEFRLENSTIGTVGYILTTIDAVGTTEWVEPSTIISELPPGSDGEMLYYDGGTSEWISAGVALLWNDISDGLTITTATQTPINVRRPINTVDANLDLVQAWMYDSNNSYSPYASIAAVVLDNTAGSVYGELSLRVADDNAYVDALSLTGGGMKLYTGSRVDEIEDILTDDSTHIPTSHAVYTAISGAGEWIRDAVNEWLEPKTFTDSINLGLTDGNTQAGVIYKDGEPFIYEFSYGDNGVATPYGKNVFIGLNVGNFTMGSTAPNSNYASYNIGIGDDIMTSTTNASKNIAIGRGTLRLITTGSSNIAIGDRALYSSDINAYNIAIGDSALLLVSGSNNYNIAIGENSQGNNTAGAYNISLGGSSMRGSSGAFTGDNNIALGYNTMNSLSSGYNNITLGTYAMHSVSTGHDNISLGYRSGYSITEGDYNIAIGNETMYDVGVTGNNNIAVGYRSLQSIGAASDNVFIGYYSGNQIYTGQRNTGIGASVIRYGDTAYANTAIGYSAMNRVASGINNVAIGQFALPGISGGTNDYSFMVSVGGLAGYGIDTGENVVFIGFQSGAYYGSSGSNKLIDADNSIYIGGYTRAYSNSPDNEIVIGSGITGHGSDTVTIGTTNTIHNYFHGDITASEVTYTSTDGTAGQALVTDGFGETSWTTIGTGSTTTIINNADNRVITGSDTADTLNAETYLTYDGTSLDILGDIVFIEGGDRTIEIQQKTTAGADSLYIQSGDAFSTTANGGDLYLTGGAGGTGSGAPIGGNVYIYGHSGDQYGKVILGWDAVSATTSQVGIGRVPNRDLDVNGEFGLTNTDAYVDTIEYSIIAGGGGGLTNDDTHMATSGAIWEAIDNATANTTYTISAETGTGGVNLRLTGLNPSSTDDVLLKAGTGTAITRTSDSVITIGLTGGGSFSYLGFQGDTGQEVQITDQQTLNLDGIDGIYTDSNSTTQSVSIGHDTTGGTSISIDNSGTTVLQDLILTIDSWGHITAASAASIDITSSFYWNRNVIGYIYPTTAGDKVIIGTDGTVTPTEMLEVEGNIQLIEGGDREIYVGKRIDAGTSHSLTIFAGDAFADTQSGGDVHISGGLGGVGSGSPTGGDVYIYGREGDSYGKVILGWDGIGTTNISTSQVGIGRVPNVDLDVNGQFGLTNTDVYVETIVDSTPGISAASTDTELVTALAVYTAIDNLSFDKYDYWTLSADLTSASILSGVQINVIGAGGITAEIGPDGTDYILTISGSALNPLTTKGDLYTYDTDPQRLPVGTDTQILSADSSQTTGLKWIDASTFTDKFLSAITVTDITSILFTVTNGDNITANFTHKEDHLLAGTDEIDGDQLGISWNPTNYTPAVTPIEVTSIDHLTAHLYGIDQAIATTTSAIYWERNASGYVYPKTTTDKVIIGTDGTVTPTEMLEVDGNIQLLGGNREIYAGERPTSGDSYDLTISGGDAFNTTHNGGDVYITGGAGGVGSGAPGGGNVYIYGQQGDQYGKVVLGWDGIGGETSKVGIGRVPNRDLDVNGDFGLTNTDAYVNTIEYSIGGGGTGLTADDTHMATSAAIIDYVGESIAQYIYLATGSIITAGSEISGTYATTNTYDGVSWTIQETNGTTPGINVELSFSLITVKPTRIWLRCYYSGNHSVDVQLWNYDTTTWVTYYTLTQHTSHEWVEFQIVSPEDYSDSGNAKMRFYHSSVGNPSHYLYIDYAAEVKSGFGSTGVNAFGVPENNQVAIWIDNNTIEGDSGFTYNGSRLSVDSYVHIKEATIPSTFTAGYGQLWVKDDSPNSLYFVDDTGASHKVSYYTGWDLLADSTTVTITSGVQVHVTGSGGITTEIGPDGTDYILDISGEALDPLTTKGDLFTFSTENERLEVGVDGYILSANSSKTTGLEWIYAPTMPTGITGGDILYWDTTGTLPEWAVTSGISWDESNTRLGINNDTPDHTLDVNGQTHIQDELFLSTVNQYLGGGGPVFNVIWDSSTGEVARSTQNITDYVTGSGNENEIGIWASDGSLEGDSKFKWDGSLLSIDGITRTTSFKYTGLVADSIISSFSISYGSGASINYVVDDGTNMRMGTMLVVWDGTNVRYSEHSTDDIGDTSGIELFASMDTAEVLINATIAFGTWDVTTSISII